jgi:hypothetical protein
MPSLRSLVIAVYDLGGRFSYDASGALCLRLPKDRDALPGSLLAHLHAQKPALTLYLSASHGALPPASLPTLPLCEPGTHVPFPATWAPEVVRQCQHCPLAWPEEEDPMHARVYFRDIAALAGEEGS